MINHQPSFAGDLKFISPQQRRIVETQSSPQEDNKFCQIALPNALYGLMPTKDCFTYGVKRQNAFSKPTMQELMQNIPGVKRIIAHLNSKESLQAVQAGLARLGMGQESSFIALNDTLDVIFTPDTVKMQVTSPQTPQPKAVWLSDKVSRQSLNVLSEAARNVHLAYDIPDHQLQDLLPCFKTIAAGFNEEPELKEALKGVANLCKNQQFDKANKVLQNIANAADDLRLTDREYALTKTAAFEAKCIVCSLAGDIVGYKANKEEADNYRNYRP